MMGRLARSSVIGKLIVKVISASERQSGIIYNIPSSSSGVITCWVPGFPSMPQWSWEVLSMRYILESGAGILLKV
jgi:hypothetical protein